MQRLDWVTGDMLGMAIPAHAEALRAGGTRFLSEAFRLSGALGPDNQVTAITQFSEVLSGGTGRKVSLSVSYQKPRADLHHDLFIKFSRDFDDTIRDRPRQMLQSEVWFAALSRLPAFPVTVPKCYFADFHQETGTGILITERIGFGEASIEPFHGKCLDYEIADVLEHYRAIVRALARLAGTHKAGRLPDTVEERFPFVLERALAADSFPYDARRLQSRVDRYAEFAREFPQLLPANITRPAFIAELREDVVHFAAHEHEIRQFLYRTPQLIALCHWNANIDNAWFWRDTRGQMQCGLMDWGRVGQMNVAASLYGSLSGAEPEFWKDHMDSLLALFADEFAGCGAPRLDPRQLRLHLHLFTAMMGLAYILDAPPVIRARIPDLNSAQSRFDACFKADEGARTQLHMITMLLNQWQTHKFGSLLGEVVGA